MKITIAKMTIAFAILLVVLVACVQSGPGEAISEIDGSTIKYFELDGMPCYWVEVNAGMHTGTAGLTCNWDKWRGVGQ